MPRTSALPVSTRGRALLGLAGGIALIALVYAAWPRPADTEVLEAYARLEQSPIPVRVVGWIQPSAPSVQLLPDGYVLRLHAEQLGDLTISGRRGAAPATPGGVVWREGEATYAVETSAARDLVQPRLVSLADAQRQLTGNTWDTNLLYLGYLPVFAIFGAWSIGSLLLGTRRG